MICTTSWTGAGRVFPVLMTSGNSSRKDAGDCINVGLVCGFEVCPQDSEGTFTCGTPEVRPCLRQVAVEAGEDVERLVRGEEAGVPEERPVSLGRGW